MGRTRRRHSSSREVAIGMVGPLAMAVALGIGLIWMQQPGRVQLSLSGAQAQSALDRSAEAATLRGPGPVPPAGEPLPAAVAGLPDAGTLPARPAGGFRTVCCRRADNTAYWTAAEWCDDVGAAVDDRLCEVALPEPGVEAASAAAAAANEAVPAPLNYTQCLRMGGYERFDARCTLLLEPVCCEQNGRINQTPRGECQERASSREVDPRMCEPVCCHRPSVPSVLWDSRGNCGDVSDRDAVVVAEEKCEEVCCQMSDRSTKRDSRRNCLARGGTSRATMVCGTSVDVERPPPVATEGLRFDDDPRKPVDVEVEVEMDVRLPAASPFL